jgi:hypothetical protein
MEFTPGGVQSVFTLVILALWDGPGTVVLLRPERTARVNQEDFKVRRVPSIHQ